MTMSGRFVDHGIRIMSSVALLLAVMCSPIRPTQASQTAPSSDDLPLECVILNTGYVGQFAMSARPSLREADSLQSDIDYELHADINDDDIDDELTITRPPASVSFILPSPSREPYLERNGFAGAPAAQPLRC